MGWELLGLFIFLFHLFLISIISSNKVTEEPYYGPGP